MKKELHNMFSRLKNSYADSRMSNILHGAGSVLDISGTYFNPTNGFNNADMNGMRNDFNNVGNDIKSSISEGNWKNF